MAIDDSIAADDFDPASPQGGGTEAPVGDAADRTNYGADGRGDLPTDEGLVEGPSPFGHPAVLAIDIGKAQAFLTACMTSHPRVTYGLGAKVKPGQVPGQDFSAVDCSGFVREAIRRSSSIGSKFPDGSYIQHQWVRANGFDPVPLASGALADGAVRIAFLEPADSPHKIGHVVLLHQGRTLESHGGVGPDARQWTMQGWQSKAHVYMLNPNPSEKT